MLIGAKTLKLLKDLITEKATFDRLTIALRKHKPLVIVIYEKFKFYNRNQLPNKCFRFYSR